MKYNELNTSSRKNPKRVGRGIAAGSGKTAGRGTKGQKSRTGSKRRPGFEGGQNPLMQRLPKLHGFNSHKTKPEVVYTGEIESLGKTKVNNQTLADATLISSPFVITKILLKGELNKKVDLQLQLASKQALEAITKAGGSFEKIPQLKRTAVESSKSSAKHDEKKS